MNTVIVRTRSTAETPRRRSTADAPRPRPTAAGAIARSCRCLAAAIVAASLPLVSCGARVVRSPELIPVPATTGGVAPGSIRDYRTALAAIADSFEEDIGLPRPAVALVLYPDRRALEAGLIEAGQEPALARQSAARFEAVGGATAVRVNAQALGRASWRQRVQLIAHELVHSVQYRLAGGRRGTSEQWLREGFADLVSFRVVEHLGMGEAALLDEWLLTPLVDAPSLARPRPLATLSTYAEWVAAQARPGAPPYAQAYVASKLLVERHGLAAIVRYFASFRETLDRDANFERAFGTSLSAFDRELAGRWDEIRLRRSPALP